MDEFLIQPDRSYESVKSTMAKSLKTTDVAQTMPATTGEAMTHLAGQHHGGSTGKCETAPAIVEKISYHPDEPLTKTQITTCTKKFNVNHFLFPEGN